MITSLKLLKDSSMTSTTTPQSTLSKSNTAHLIMFSLLALGLILVFWYTNLQLKREQQKITLMSVTLKTEKQQLQSALQQTRQEIEQNITEQHQQFQQAFRQAMAEQAGHQQQWTLYKAKYFLELAAINAT